MHLTENTRKRSEDHLIPTHFLKALSSSEKKGADEIGYHWTLFDAGIQGRQVQD